MKRLIPIAFLILLTMAPQPGSADEPVSDLRRAVPADAYLVTYGQHNPERDDQRVHFQRVFESVTETRLIERVVKTITLHLAPGERERALAMFDEIKTAAAPIDLQALLDCQEAVYAQRMEPFQVGEEDGHGATLSTSQHLILLRLTPEVARDYHRGLKNLFQVLDTCCEGNAAIDSETQGSTTLTTISLPGKAPYCPAIARVDDLLLFSSSCHFARESLAMLLGNGESSKFDDARLAEALRQLPQPEDAVVFYDGRQQFQQMREMVDTLERQIADKPEARRWVQLSKTIFDEVAILDFMAAVEYTDGNRNCVETLGQLLPNCEHRLLTEMLDSGQPFPDWHRWVPADATAYALTTGADFHPVYRRMVQVIREQIPELQLPLEVFEKWQRRIDLHLDVDLLQAFSGECVSVTLPTDQPSTLCDADIVWALRCHKPSRMGWLLERLVDHLNTYPLIKAQQLQLVESAELEGFQEVSAAICQLFGMNPVVGFHDGWMFVGTSAQAVQQVLDTRRGQADSIAETPAFQQFQLELEGPVRSVRFVNVARQTQQIAQGLRQVGAVMPIIIGLAEAKAETEQEMQELVPLRVLAEVLPSLGQIISELDFFESQLTVTRDGDQPGTWREHRVMLVRPADATPSVTSH